MEAMASRSDWVFFSLVSPIACCGELPPPRSDSFHILVLGLQVYSLLFARWRSLVAGHKLCSWLASSSCSKSSATIWLNPGFTEPGPACLLWLSCWPRSFGPGCGDLLACCCRRLLRCAW